MNDVRRTTWTTTARAAVPLAAAALLLAGCGGSGDDSSTAAASTPATTSTAASTTAGAASAAPGGTQQAARIDLKDVGGELGKILVGSDGLTVYLFEKDTGTESTCYDACAAAWPPVLTTGAPTAGTGIDAKLLGTTTRHDGATQVTYNGHPLYRYVHDTGPGQTAGQDIDGFGAEWYVLSAKGDKVD